MAAVETKTKKTKQGLGPVCGLRYSVSRVGKMLRRNHFSSGARSNVEVTGAIEAVLRAFVEDLRTGLWETHIAKGGADEEENTKLLVKPAHIAALLRRPDLPWGAILGPAAVLTSRIAHNPLRKKKTPVLSTSA